MACRRRPWQYDGPSTEDFFVRKLLLPILLVFWSSMATAEEIDTETMTAIITLVTKGYDDPTSVEIRNVHKSRARNGNGYCGEIAVEDGADFTVFHAIIESITGPSVLRLADYPDGTVNGRAVRQLLRNFGCLE
jgi:hypothetical protein